MPLYDHFHPPLAVQRHWEGLHGAWATSLALSLNERLPEGYFAEPGVHWGSRIEIDVATWGARPPRHTPGDHGSATAVWSPPEPGLRLSALLPRVDVAEVRIHRDMGGPSLVAAIELVSPGNKDREEHQTAFATKCHEYLLRDVCVLVVDIVTSRRSDMHHALLEALGRPDAALPGEPLHAATYRRAPEPDTSLECWVERLRLGAPLPEMPLWIDRDVALPVDLEGTYTQTCRGLRIGPGFH